MKSRILVFLAAVLFSTCMFLPTSFAADTSDAVAAVETAAAINEASLNLNLAFVAVATAEDAGVDVEVFLAQLEAAGGFLSEAHLAFRDMDYEVASSLAEECNESVKGLAFEATRLATKTKREINDNLILTVVGSGIGLILLFVFGGMGWVVLRGRYYSRILEMKPELEESS